MANELLTRDDVVRGKKNFDAQNQYMTGTAEEQVTLPDGKKVKTRAGLEKEITDKFPDSKAGLRDIGNEVGQVPVMTEFGLGSTGWGELSPSQIPSGLKILSKLTRNGNFYINNSEAASISDIPVPSRGVLINQSYDKGQILFQQYRIESAPFLFFRIVLNSAESTTLLQDWSTPYMPGNKKPYTTTTATSANVVVTDKGELQRSTSSAIFKKDIANIIIPDYRAALKAVRPVSYRSTDSTSDRTDWSWYSFIAEELGELDKRLVQMDSTEFFEDTKEDGTPFINSRELPEGEYAANGINTNGIVALMVHISQQMLGDIEKLEDEKTQLKRRMTGLEKRLDALDSQAAAE